MPVVKCKVEGGAMVEQPSGECIYGETVRNLYLRTKIAENETLDGPCIRCYNEEAWQKIWRGLVRWRATEFAAYLDNVPKKWPDRVWQNMPYHEAHIRWLFPVDERESPSYLDYVEGVERPYNGPLQRWQHREVQAEAESQRSGRSLEELYLTWPKETFDPGIPYNQEYVEHPGAWIKSQPTWLELPYWSDTLMDDYEPDAQWEVDDEIMPAKPATRPSTQPEPGWSPFFQALDEQIASGELPATPSYPFKLPPLPKRS